MPRYLLALSIGFAFGVRMMVYQKKSVQHADIKSVMHADIWLLCRLVWVYFSNTCIKPIVVLKNCRGKEKPLTTSSF